MPIERDTRFEWDIMGSNTRCELAEGVAFDKRLAHLDEVTQMDINNLIMEYLRSMFGPTTKD